MPGQWPGWDFPGLQMCSINSNDLKLSEFGYHYSMKRNEKVCKAQYNAWTIKIGEGSGPW